MNRVLYLMAASLVAVTTGVAAADPPSRAFWLGPFAGVHLAPDSWDLNEDFRSTSSPSVVSAMAGLRIGGQPLWWLGIEGAVGFVPFQSDADDTNLALTLDADLLFFLTRTDWQPFLVAGGGAYSNLMGDHGSDTDWQGHYGLGVRGWLTDMLALRIEARHVLTDSGLEDRFLGSNIEVLIGLDIALWIGDDTPSDRDSDGIIDDDDRCPDTPGLREFAGCPDTDGDGLADPDDRCPKRAGPRENEGCPVEKPSDRDGDGVIDTQDRCPDTPGAPKHAGCPDTDGDGIIDIEDRCPKVAGPAGHKGCPDRDGDGLPDIDDKCPDEPGPAALQGCPPTFDGTLEGINFEVDSAEITASSREVLEAVAAELEKFPNVHVRIEGHTDARASDDYNQGLSERRARSVKTWLVNAGIDGGRMTTIGYGEKRPVASNETDEGRARNRRIEFHVTRK